MLNSGEYAVWRGRKVGLLIDAGESPIPLRVQLLSESTGDIRVRLDGRWDVDIPKEMVLQVSEDISHFPSEILVDTGKD